MPAIIRSYKHRFRWSRWKIAPHDTEALRAAIEVEREVEFWGQKYRVTPRLVTEIFGDGKRLAFLEPANTRPDCYVFRGDSSWTIGDDRDRKIDPREWTEEVLNAIEDQFGTVTDDWCDECDDDPDMERHEHEHRGFPALSDDSGYCWGLVEWPIKYDPRRPIVVCRGEAIMTRAKGDA